MTEVTQILSEIERGDPAAAEMLLPLVYDALRQLAVAKIANEKPGQTLQATALVHEAYVRLVDGEKVQDWNSRIRESHLAFKYASYHLKSWQFSSAAQDFAINDVNRHLCAAFADADRVALVSSIHLR